MPINASIEGVDIRFSFDSLTGEGVLVRSQQGDELLVDMPLNLDGSVDKEDYDIYFLSNKSVGENDVYQVFTGGDNRIGWVIPANTLSSSDHDFSDNIHFLRYAYVAVAQAIDQLDERFFSETVNADGGSVLFSDFFHDSTVFLIVCRSKVEGGTGFDIDRAVPSLIQHGYVRLDSSSPEGIKLVGEKPQQKLHLQISSSEVENIEMISELLNRALAYEEKPVFRFFFMYQIFELLMERVYKEESEELIDQLVRSRSDPGATRNIVSKIQKSLSEKERIALLANKYSSASSLFPDLSCSCNSFLNEVGRDGGEAFQDFFYPIRNFVFHSYRDMSGEAESILDKIVEDSLRVIPAILKTFSIPRV